MLWNRWNGLVVTLGAVMLMVGCASSAKKAEGPREVAISVTDAGFVPAQVVIRKDEAVTLVVTRKTEQTCATAMFFEGSTEEHALPFNQAVRIDLPAGQPDTLRYACGMNMIKGEILAK